MKNGHRCQKKPRGFRGWGGGGNPAQSLPFEFAFTFTDRRSRNLRRLRLAARRLDFPRRGEIAGAPDLGGSLGA